MRIDRRYPGIQNDETFLTNVLFVALYIYTITYVLARFNVDFKN